MRALRCRAPYMLAMNSFGEQDTAFRVGKPEVSGGWLGWDKLRGDVFLNGRGSL
jgi:hypothetical protein